MKYSRVIEGVFLERPNRFIARVSIKGKTETVHVKNTGRCRELLQPGTRVYLEEADRPGRKTKYDLIAAEKLRFSGAESGGRRMVKTGNIIFQTGADPPGSEVQKFQIRFLYSGRQAAYLSGSERGYTGTGGQGFLSGCSHPERCKASA